MKVALIGYGKMGRTIEGILNKTGTDEVVARIRSSNAADVHTLVESGTEVAIEFSRPETAVDNIRSCIGQGIPIVVGTTAWLDRLDEVKDYCSAQNGALFFAPNFSIGVNLFMEVNRRLSRLMAGQSDYRASMEEIHHTEKLDAPSGTAIRLAEELMDAHPAYRKWVEGEAQTSDELGILSKRSPEVPGTHVIRWRSSVDQIEIRHEAFSREGFAMGAVAAARWLIGRRGFFGMTDLLKS